MWSVILEIIVYLILLLTNYIPSVTCHIPSYVTTPANKNDQFCQLSENCMHDTIRVCGRMGEKKRTFLDMCDLLEFACDTNQIYVHIEDEEGCPEPAVPPPGGIY
ncbi:unnamed protein product [Spodoptera littoralis]|uniref:Kazal-like domain-containing protein n=1 Tax=Spodoptera littoralis TaxID=7109 RepID=A0A9P0HXG1_SPOLI|nr:unnamed protein product [Spodoptera littoralis]CAH1635985.1 unnamed protein product [Spodoptera littoralis]